MTDGRNPDLDEHLYEKPGDFEMNAGDEYVVEVPLDLSSTYRIEALRAASRVVAAYFHSGGMGHAITEQRAQGAESYTIALAEQFARWLEEGK